MTPDELHMIETQLDCLLENKPLNPQEDSVALGPIQEKIQALSAMLGELTGFALQLSAGNVDATPPPRTNYLASSLKQLQAQMMHLTWQAQCVAQGDYMQRIDFMGEFSDAFNEMVEQLSSRETSLKEQREVMERIFNLIEPIIVISEQKPDEVLYLNEMAAVRFGAHAGINLRYNDSLARILKLPPSSIERQILDEETERWYGVTVRKLRWGSENHARLFYCRDITSHKQRESRLSDAANTDGLTGINNRRAFDQAYGKLWYTSMSARKPISVLVFDLDHFKDFNDQYGHLDGDRMLMQFASILSLSVGRGDDVIARYGGEEFIVALPFTNEENALRIAKSICDRTAARTLQVKDADGRTIEAEITVSAGISTVIPTHVLQPSQLVQAADRALFDSKQRGRNRVSYRTIESGNSPAES